MKYAPQTWRAVVDEMNAVDRRLSDAMNSQGVGAWDARPRTPPSPADRIAAMFVYSDYLAELSREMPR